MQTTLSDNGGCSCKYTPWGRLAHLRSSSGPDRWQEWTPNGVGTWRHDYRCGRCHAKLPRLPFHSGGIALPQALSSEGSTKHEFSSKRSTFSYKDMLPLHWGIENSRSWGAVLPNFWWDGHLTFWEWPQLSGSIKDKLSSSVASSVWDSRKLEIIVGLPRAVVLRAWPSACSNVTCWPSDSTSDCGNSGCRGQHSVF